MNKILWQQYGLSEINGKRIIDVLSRFSEVQEAVLFGSRAKGNYNRGSDIDIAVKGTISKDVLSALLVAFDETVLPYFVDIVSVICVELISGINAFPILVALNPAKHKRINSPIRTIDL